MTEEVLKSVSAKLSQAIEAQKIGSLVEAETLYKQVLELDPNQPNANHNMGVLMVASGKLLEAKPFFEIALKWIHLAKIIG